MASFTRALDAPDPMPIDYCETPTTNCHHINASHTCSHTSEHLTPILIMAKATITGCI